MTDEKSTVVLVEDVEIAEAGALVLIRIRGSHFLWKMVRRVVGVLAAVGRGELEPGHAASSLAGTEVAKMTAPAAGLFLERVSYPGDGVPGPLTPVLNVAAAEQRGASGARWGPSRARAARSFSSA